MELHRYLTTPVPVVVRRAMNDHGTMTVETAETNECRHLVDYASDRVRTALADLPAGAVVPVEMHRVGARSNVWQANRLPSVAQGGRHERARARGE